MHSGNVMNLRRLFDWTKKHKKRLLVAAALLMFGVFILLNLVAYNQAYAMSHFTAEGERTAKPENLSLSGKARVLFCGVTVPRPHGTATPSDVGLQYEELTIQCSNGIRLGAWHCPVPQNTSHGLVLLFHGYGGDKSSVLTEAAHFHALGWSTLLVDFRGSGQSSETYTSIGYFEGEDVAEALRFARATLPYSKFVFFGQSMGAAAILRAASAYGANPDAMIVESVFDSMLTTVKNRFEIMGLPAFPCAQLLMFWGGRQLNFDTFSHNPVNYAKNVTCPCLFLHGSDDPRARIAEARRVYDAVPSAKHFQEFKGAKHESLARHSPEEWNTTVENFLNGIPPTPSQP